MSVLVRGMDIPKSCYKCQLRRRNGMDIFCPIVHERFSVADINILEYRLDNCPLVFVPPHGRLIDADALDSSHTDLLGNHLVYLVDIDDAPTVIPAEEGET